MVTPINPVIGLMDMFRLKEEVIKNKRRKKMKKYLVKIKNEKDLETIKNNVFQILEKYDKNVIVEASEFQIEVLRQLGFSVLEMIND